MRPARITVASAPEIRSDGIKDRRLPFCLGAILGSLALAVGLAFLRDWLDARVQDIRQVELSARLPMLGTVPAIKDLRAGHVTRQDFAESYRVVRTTLASLRAQGHPLKSILVTSAQAGEGKTSLAVSLAMSLAEPGDRVLLIDGDIQVPNIGRLLKLNVTHGLKEVLRGQMPLSNCVLASGVPGLDVLPAKNGVDSAQGYLNTGAAQRIVREAAAIYDHVVIDSPPALGAADALVWASAADGVILSSLIGGSDRAALQLVCERLHMAGARLAGVVAANVSINESYYSTSRMSKPFDAADTHAAELTRPIVCLPGASTDAEKA